MPSQRSLKIAANEHTSFTVAILLFYESTVRSEELENSRERSWRWRDWQYVNIVGAASVFHVYILLWSAECDVTKLRLDTHPARHCWLWHWWSPAVVSVCLIRSVQSRSNYFNCCIGSQPFNGTLKPQNSGPLYNNTVRYTGRWWVDTYILYSKEGPGWAAALPSVPPRCTKCNSPPINSQCTNFILFNVAL